MLLVLMVGLAGGLGAATRFLLAAVISRRLSRSDRAGPMPWATIVINVTGSFLLGAITGAAGAHLLDDRLAAVLGTGFCGGYTTFSTASVETFRLLERRMAPLAVLNALGTAAAALAAAALGWWLTAR